MDSDHSMMAEIKSAGLDLASVDELKSQLKQYSGGTYYHSLCIYYPIPLGY